MAECLDQRQAPDIPRLASEGFSVALAIEIEASRQATTARRGPNRVARASAAISGQADTMKTHRIAGGAGVQLHVVETGNPQGRPILFIHGASQCWLQWNRQMNSSLAEEHRLVALDMRGHGISDKPHDGYNDSKLWAEDVHAVIQALNLDHPVLRLVLWSPCLPRLRSALRRGPGRWPSIRRCDHEAGQ